MKIQFNFLGLSCEAVGSMENGQFIANAISAKGLLDDEALPSKLFDELCKAMDSAAHDTKTSYRDDTACFGEQI